MAQTTHSGLDRGDDVRRAKPLGLLVTLLGTLLLFISIFFDWVGLGQEDNEAYFRSGYESDSVIPFMALLGVGFSAALIYAMMKADRRQHRGLTLASFAVGLASFLWILFFLFDPISTVQYGGAEGENNPNVTTSWAVWLGLIGALLWAVGSALLAKEPEGDAERDQARHEPARVQTTQHVTDVHHTAHTDHVGTHGVESHHSGYPATGTTHGTTPASATGQPYYTQGGKDTDHRTR